jgi:uncharacterized protein involved in outer membrane biogenesis
MKAVKILLIVAAALVLVVAGGLFFLTRFVNTPQFKDQLLNAARDATGTEVKIGEMNVAIFRGIDLRDVTIGNPDGFTGELLTAKSFALHYRLWPLLRKRVEVETLALDSPVITLVKNDAGDWNYDQLGGGESKPAAEKSASPAPAKTSGPSSRLDIAVDRIEMKHATFVMRKASGAELLRVTDANFSSRVSMSGHKLTGAGHASLAEAVAAGSLFLRQVSAPVAMDGDHVKLAPLSGKVADGALAGDAGLVGSKYVVNLQIKDADVVKLIQEAGVAKPVFSSGKLQLNTALSGTGGLETIIGDGKAEITGGQLVGVPVLTLVGALLQVPVLQNLKFDECRLEYTISNNVMQTPLISLKSPQAQISGAGRVALEDYSLNHTLTLALAKEALERAPKEIRQLFTERADGFVTMEFKVWGPYDKPKTDLDKRLLKGVGEQLLEKGLKQLMK